MERHQVMLAGGIERDVLNDDHFTVAEVEGPVQDGKGIFMEPAKQFLSGAGYAGRGVGQSRPFRVLPDGQKVLADGPFPPWPVHTFGDGRFRRQDRAHASARSSRTMTDLEVGVPLVSATESSGTRTLVSG